LAAYPPIGGERLYDRPASGTAMNAMHKNKYLYIKVCLGFRRYLPALWKSIVEVVKAHKLSTEWHPLQPGAINSRV